ncbi:MAG: glycerol kinase GlpK [Hyphomicrobiales bacterium]
MSQYILSLDQGTTSSRAIIFDHSGSIKAIAQKEFEQKYPKPGWIEHDPNEIWFTQVGVAAEVIAKLGITGLDLAAIGITNQRETTVIWDRETGLPVYNAIVWQDRRTSDYCNKLKEEGHGKVIREKTGLIIDAYFSATKIKWILDNVEGARDRANKGKLAFGTIDSWLVWKFTRGRSHVTDVSNASRTMLFNINTLEWDNDLLDLFDIPQSLLPEVRSSSEIYDHTNTTFFAHKVPIGGIAGDQQAALFGQMCTEKGMLKNTYGTGCFMMLNTGDKLTTSKNNLLSTIGWKVDGKVTYALEGSIFISGAIVQWLRDGLGIIKHSSDIENLAKTVDDNGGLYFVPALTGLGAPYWDQYARGTAIGITRGTTSGHFARAALEGMAYQVYDVLKSMEADAGCKVLELRVDGGASANNLLLQFQSDILDTPVIRPKITETTALGAAYLAGLAVGFWKDIEELKKQWEVDRHFKPAMKQENREDLLKGWNKALDRSRNWID